MATISKEWEKGSEETRKSLAEGNGITFPNAEEAIKWLKVGDTTNNTFSTPSYLTEGLRIYNAEEARS